jgi:ectoine hydroxylase-related dioxygenase (phytanoyl-CoA dioxygenase family)
MPLTQEQIDSFQQNGFLVLGKVLTDDELAELRGEYDRVFAEANQTGKYNNLMVEFGAQEEKKRAAPRQMLQVMQMCERSLAYRRLLYDERILEVIETLMGPNIMLFHDQALFKPANTGGPIPWHQDNAYWKCRPANLVSCWMTLDDAAFENGAMQMIPGSHLRPLIHPPAESSVALVEHKEIDESKRVVVELPAGGMMFHHCQTLHHTEPNTTDRQRRAFAIHYMPPGTVWGKGELLRVDYHHPMLRARM